MKRPALTGRPRRAAHFILPIVLGALLLALVAPYAPSSIYARSQADASAGVSTASPGAAPSPDSFEKVVLDDNVHQLLKLAVAPDGRVFFVERCGAVKVYRPDIRSTVLAAQLNVWCGIEDGLLGIALDPNFETTQWVYLFYSPAARSQQNVSRFTLNGGFLDIASEKVLLEIPTQRQECCHSAGSLQFDTQGNL